MPKIPLDTDIGEDMDDVCVLAMQLWVARSRHYWRDDRLLAIQGGELAMSATFWA